MNKSLFLRLLSQQGLVKVQAQRWIPFQATGVNLCTIKEYLGHFWLTDESNPNPADTQLHPPRICYSCFQVHRDDDFILNVLRQQIFKQQKKTNSPLL